MDNSQRNYGPRPTDDPRIPVAWRQREMSFNSPYARRPSSASMTSSSSDDREEIPIVRQPYRPLSRHSNVTHMDRRDEPRLDHYATIRNERLGHLSPCRNERMDTYCHRNTPPIENYFHPPCGFSGNVSSGTLRSTRSVPALAFAATMDGHDACPVHGGTHGPMRRHGSLFDVRSPPLGGPLSLAGLDKKNFYGSKHSLIGHPHPHFQLHPDLPPHLPPHMMNAMMRPPHSIGMPIIMEPIPMRGQFNKIMTLPRNGQNGYPTKEPADPYSVEQVCCKGHLIVLWIILGVVTVGVILGIIMGVTIT